MIFFDSYESLSVLSAFTKRTVVLRDEEFSEFSSVSIRDDATMKSSKSDCSNSYVRGSNSQFRKCYYAELRIEKISLNTVFDLSSWALFSLV